MSTYYHGEINLSRIPKELIVTKENGDKVVYVDFLERRQPSQYGQTHYIQLYDKNTKEKHYLGDFKPQEFGNGRPVATNNPFASAPSQEENDLPF